MILRYVFRFGVFRAAYPVWRKRFAQRLGPVGVFANLCDNILVLKQHNNRLQVGLDRLVARHNLVSPPCHLCGRENIAWLATQTITTWTGGAGKSEATRPEVHR